MSLLHEIPVLLAWLSLSTVAAQANLTGEWELTFTTPRGKPASTRIWTRL